eukprot:gene18092-21016_t
MVHLAKTANAELRSLLDECLLQRNKTMLQGDHALKGTDEIIVFCDLSPLQQRMYEQCLACPDDGCSHPVPSMDQDPMCWSGDVYHCVYEAISESHRLVCCRWLRINDSRDRRRS